jgi:hypothetical protein
MTEQKTTARRRYIVIDADQKERLILATSPAQAVTHAYKTKVSVASQDDLERLIRAGTETESVI